MGSCAGSQLLQAREARYLERGEQPTARVEDIKQTIKTALEYQISDDSNANQQKQAKKTEETSLFKHFNHLIFEIEKELKIHEQLYNKYLDVAIIIDILQEFSKLYISHESAVEIINIVLDFMTFCRNHHQGQSQNTLRQSNFSGQYLSELSERWIKVREAVYFFNKDHLKLLNYICQGLETPKMEYSHCFLSLKFDLSLDQAREVSNVVRKMCQVDVRSFSYLSNYLFTSCVNLERTKKLSMNQIEYAYQEVLESLSEENPPAPPIEAEDRQLDYHISIKFPQDIPKCQIDLYRYKTEQEKQFALEAFIMSKASESMLQFDRFNLILKEICLKNDGYRFKSGVKLKNKTQRKAMTRIKQKMLGNIFNEVDLQKNLTSSIRDAYLKNFIDIYSYTKQEYGQFQEKMKKIFHKVDKPIEFKVSDMLRGKCVFSSVQKINKCCSDIKIFINSHEKDGFRLIEVDNRLRKQNSDLVMKILFGTTIAQLQLVKDLNLADYEFSHKLYELQRSKFFTPLTQLAILNQNISKDYFLEVKALILANSIKKGYNYDEKITYMEPMENFKDFFHKLQIKINFFQTHPSEIDIKMMKNQQEKFKKLIESKIKLLKQQQQTQNYEQSLNNGVYFYQTKKYDKALKVLQCALKQFESVNCDLLMQLTNGSEIHHDNRTKLDKYVKMHAYSGRTYEELGNYEQAHKSYEVELKIKEKLKGKYNVSIAITLNNIGNVYQLQGNYGKALQYYQKCLQIKQKSHGKANYTIATTLNNIGGVYRSQSNFPKALQYYEKCLALQESIKGKDSIQIATSLNNIGLVHKNQGDYTKALQYFQRCLYIKQKVKGKDSIGIAITYNNIGNVYQLQGNYVQALQYYQKGLEIQEKVKGKDSISITSALNNIGLVYDAQSNYPKALEYFQRCLSINTNAKGKDNIDIAPILNNIGEAHKNQGDYQKAIEYYSEAIRIYKKHGVTYRGLANSFSNIGYSFYKLKQYKTAIQNFEQSLQTYEKINMNEEARSCAQYIAKCYKGMTETGKMREFISRYQLKFWEI